MEYFVLEYEDLDSRSSEVDVPYQILETQMSTARTLNGKCVYFRRYTLWNWIIIDNALPVDWVMALFLI